MTSHTTFAFAMRTLREQPLATVDAAEVGARINELLGLPPSAGFVPRSIKAIGDLFRYPDESFGERLAEGLSVFRGETEASQALERFAEGIVVLGRATQQATYTGTFDVAPACSPYLGAHLFGAETPERVRLMIRLRDCYRRGGIDGDSIELPDHVAEVLSFGRALRGRRVARSRSSGLRAGARDDERAPRADVEPVPSPGRRRAPPRRGSVRRRVTGPRASVG